MSKIEDMGEKIEAIEEEEEEDEEEEVLDSHEEEEEEEEEEDDDGKDNNNNNNNDDDGSSQNPKNDTSHKDAPGSPGKIFIGGLSKETSSSAFNSYFKRYGDIIDSVIMKDKVTGHPRGFGFVTYSDPSVIDKVLKDKHVLDGKTVEIKRTIPKAPKGGKTKKIFVGGIPTSITADQLKDFFSKFGKIVDQQIMQKRSTGESRGFGFVTFDSEKVVDHLLSKHKTIEIAGKQVELKRAEPKKPLSAPAPTYGRSPYMMSGDPGPRDRYSGSWSLGPPNNAYDYGRGYASEYDRYPDGYWGRESPYVEGAGAYGMSSRYTRPSDVYGGGFYGGYGGSYDARVGNSYSAGSTYSSARGGHGGARYHPYTR